MDYQYSGSVRKSQAKTLADWAAVAIQIGQGHPN